MPNYNLHIEIAKEAADRLGHSLLLANLGSYLLGSTAPDIRIITKGVREQYHFAPLDFQELGAGVQGLFHAQPHLSDSSRLPGPTTAFVAGYICHILADELWILKMYRPFFGNRKVFVDAALGNLLDRALQLDLDRQAREHLGEMSHVRPLIESARSAIDVGFIPAETIALWRNWLLMAIEKRFNWERLRFVARRISLYTDETATLELCEKFLESVPRGLERVYQVIGMDRVHTYKELSVKESERSVGNYLP